MVLLSYILSNKMRFYKAKLRNIKQHKIDTFEKFNRETILEIDSHTGTHIDYPAHCVKKGKYGNAYPVDYLCSHNVDILFLDVRGCEIPRVSLEMLQKCNIDKRSEMIIIKTFFSHLRDYDRYIWESPIIDSNIACYLKKNFPKIKAIGFDIISVTSQLDKDEGKRCHHALLSHKNGQEILIIEDMDLSKINKGDAIHEITILPLLFEKMDGSPCNVIAKMKKK